MVWCGVGVGVGVRWAPDESVGRLSDKSDKVWQKGLVVAKESREG